MRAVSDSKGHAKGLLGRKVGMTQIYAEDGAVVPVTVLELGPCRVVQRKTAASDGYEAVQIGLVEKRPPKRITEARRGHFKKAGVEAMRHLAEVRVDAANESQPGDEIAVSVFEVGSRVDVIGTGKGKGFQGVMRRHGFGGGRASHGSMFHRAPGSVGQSASPSRVFPGMRFPGRMGGKRVTTKKLVVVKVDEENRLLYVRGAVPGGRNGLVMVRSSV